MLWPGLGWGILSTLLVMGAFVIASNDSKSIVPTLSPALPTPNLTPILLPIGTPITLITATSHTEQTCPIPSNWVPHEVLPGETLEHLALQADLSIEQLMAANCLVSPNLMPETILYLPASTVTPLSYNLPSPTVTGCVSPPGWIFYRVQRGDTLTRIGGLYGISVWQLKQANCLVTDTIITGQYLRVPNVATRTFTPTTSPQPEIQHPSDTPVPPTMTHTVVTTTFTPVPSETPTPTASYTPSSTPTETPTPTSTEITMVIEPILQNETFRWS